MFNGKEAEAVKSILLVTKLKSFSISKLLFYRNLARIHYSQCGDVELNYYFIDDTCKLFTMQRRRIKLLFLKRFLQIIHRHIDKYQLN